MKLTKKQFNNLRNSFIFIVSMLLILILVSYFRKIEFFTVGMQNNTQNEENYCNNIDDPTSLIYLYRCHLLEDFDFIFPEGNRNGGGAHFFKYAYDKFKNQHTPKYSTT